MKLIAVVLTASLLISAVPARAATDDDDGWQAFGHALTLVQTLMRIAAHSEDPQKGMDDVLAGRNTEANRALAGLLEEATADMPAQYRDKVAAIGRDLAAVARKGVPASAERSLQARKELHAMGLRYHDSKEFLDAVKRDDALAVELFVAGRGVNLASRDADGRSALEIARANGNDRIAGLLARNLHAVR